MKLAPEHAATRHVLKADEQARLREVYEAYEDGIQGGSAPSCGKDQHLVNYFIVGHPGHRTRRGDAVELFEKLLDRNYSPEQAQEFLPLPMTRGMVQFATGKDPLTGEEVAVARTERERKAQKALVRWKDPKNQKLVEQTLRENGRADLLPRFRELLDADQQKLRRHGDRRKQRRGSSKLFAGARGSGAPRENPDLDVAG